MDNRFRVSTYRFHTLESSKLLVTGFFETGDVGESRLIIKLDKQELSYTFEEIKRLEGGSVFRMRDDITKDYYVWIELPEHWKKARQLQIYVVNQSENKRVFRISVSKLKRVEKRFPKFIDTISVREDGFTIAGWCVSQDETPIHFYETTGKELSVDIKKKRRTDVRHAFPENSEDEVVGFEGTYKGTVPRKIKINFHSGNVEQEYFVSLKASFSEKFFAKLKKACIKAKEYYRQYGMKATINRIVDKITGRDSITYKKFYARHCPTKTMLNVQREHRFDYQPKISIVVPLYKTPHVYLNELIESIKAQTYTNWELCLSDGSGVDSPLIELLRKYEQEDARIKVVFNPHPLQISENTNAALKIATGDYIGFADHDDLLAPNALYECVNEINKDISIDMIYTDEDKIDMQGKEHFMPHFKSDFNIDMLRCTNYFCHFVVVKRAIFERAGYLNSEFDGAQDYDFVLRCVEVSDNIKHIPKILYHWRAHKDSTAENPESKDYAFKAGARAVQAHYNRVGIDAIVEETRHKGIYRTKYNLKETPLISIIIPNKDHVEDLKVCISSLENKCDYENYEIIIVENNSTEEETFKYYKEIQQQTNKIKVVYWEGKGFNYPSINNYGVEHSNGEYVLFLNNDTEILNHDCLEEMLSYCMRPDVGAVGARLYYEDGTIQHAGVIVGLGGVGGHAFVGCAHEDPGYFGRIHMAQDYSAVTAACMMVKKEVFVCVKGFDEAYAVAFNDIDLCMKIRQEGYLIVYTPYAELNHYESKSRGHEDTQEKVERFNSEVDLFKTRWRSFLKKGDPYYNPNLTLDKNDFSLNIHVKSLN